MHTDHHSLWNGPCPPLRRVCHILVLPGTTRRNALTLALVLGSTIVALTVSAPVVAAQSGGMTDVVQSPGVVSQDVILVMGMMTVMAVAVLAAFGYLASRTSSNDDHGSAQSSSNARDGLELTDLEHVAESRADTLRDAGYESVAEVHEAEHDALTDVDGFGPARVERITESAATLLEHQDDTGAPADNASTVEERGGEDKKRDTPATTDEDERPRAVVTFDSETASAPKDVDEESPPDEAEHEDHLRFRTILSTIFTGPDPNPTPDNTSAAEEDDSSTAESTDAGSSTVTAAITQGENGERTGTDAKPEPASSPKSEQTAIERARATVTGAFAVICGRARMVCDRRALDLRAYGVEDEWTALTFECGEPDSAVAHELLEEIVHVRAVPVEVATDPERHSESECESESGAETSFADHTHAHLTPDSHVRVPRRSIKWVETAAQADCPEAKRTVTLLRRALRATGASSAEVAAGGQ